MSNLRYRQPVIVGVFYKIWHWDRTDVPALDRIDLIERFPNCG